jgi:hypothetical protein
VGFLQAAPNVAVFRSTFDNGNGMWTGRTAYEYPSTVQPNHSDSCYFPNSAIPDLSDGHTLNKSTVITGSEQFDDLLSFGSTATNYYRAQNRAPCAAILYQAIALNCASSAGSDWDVAGHQLILSIGVTGVGACKDGDCHTTTWP